MVIIQIQYCWYFLYGIDCCNSCLNCYQGKFQFGVSRYTNCCQLFHVVDENLLFRLNPNHYLYNDDISVNQIVIVHVLRCVFTRDISWYTSPNVVDTVNVHPLSSSSISGFICCFSRWFRHGDNFLSQFLMSHCFFAWGLPLVGQFWGVFTGFLWRFLAKNSSSSNQLLLMSLYWLFSFSSLTFPTASLQMSWLDHIPDKLPVPQSLSCSLL